MALDDYRTALVTGASSGIGAATARALSRRGVQVHAVARRGDRLEDLAAECGCIAHVVDLRDTEALYDRIGGLEIDILVNNAGLGRGYEALFMARPEDIDTTIETNVLAALHVLRALVPGMVARRRGHIVNIGSIAGLYPLRSALYGASKGAVHLLSQNLRLELKGTGIRVTEICPGRVHTEFFDVAVDDPAKRAELTTGFELLTPADIAEAIIYALDTPWRVNVTAIELTPTEQVPGGITDAPVSKI